MISTANSYQEHSPAAATCTHARAGVCAVASATSAGARCPVKVGQPTWSSTTVSVSRSAASLQHRRREARAGVAEQPGAADDRVAVGRGQRDRPLAQQLGRAVDRARTGRVGLDVRARSWSRRRRSRSRRGRPRRRPRRRPAASKPGAGRVDGGGSVRIGLGAVDVRVGGAVDHRVGAAPRRPRPRPRRRSLISSSARVSATTSWSAARAAACTSVPSIPPAPVIRSFIIASVTGATAGVGVQGSASPQQHWRLPTWPASPIDARHMLANVWLMR